MSGFTNGPHIVATRDVGNHRMTLFEAPMIMERGNRSETYKRLPRRGVQCDGNPVLRRLSSLRAARILAAISSTRLRPSSIIRYYLTLISGPAFVNRLHNLLPPNPKRPRLRQRQEQNASSALSPTARSPAPPAPTTKGRRSGHKRVELW